MATTSTLTGVLSNVDSAGNVYILKAATDASVVSISTSDNSVIAEYNNLQKLANALGPLAFAGGGSSGGGSGGDVSGASVGEFSTGVTTEGVSTVEEMASTVVEINTTVTNMSSQLEEIASEIEAINTGSGSFLTSNNIYNGLNCTETGYVLDARQGKALSQAITDIETDLIGALNEAY